MTRRVALLRGLNVGGHNKVLMADLRGVFTALGFDDVGTIIQSGNVCFTQPSGHPGESNESRLAEIISDAIGSELGIETSVVLRTPEQLETAMAAHPYPAGEVEPKLHHIMFLDSIPKHGLDQLADVSPADPRALIGREIHLAYPQGSARSKLTLKIVESRLGVVATARNLPTCEKILDQLAG